MANPEVYCTNCNWKGMGDHLDGIKCPKCGEGKYISNLPWGKPTWFPVPKSYDIKVNGMIKCVYRK